MNINNAPTSASSFLEQFRYTIVASQLLNDHSNRSSHKVGPLPIPRLHDDRSTKGVTADNLEATPIGLSMTVGLAFLVIPFARWVLSGSTSSSTNFHLAARIIASVTVLACTYYQHRRAKLRQIRSHVIEAVSGMISSLQDFEDAVSSNAILIHEKEILSQGYKRRAKSLIDFKPLLTSQQQSFATTFFKG